jgi:hypothetical protein
MPGSKTADEYDQAHLAIARIAELRAKDPKFLVSRSARAIED